MRIIKEKAIIFPAPKGENLFGILSLPKGGKKIPAVILIHGFAKTKSERKFVELAKELVNNGIAAFRFDFSGCGDSEGKFKDMKISNQVEELNAAFQRLIKEKPMDSKRIAVFAHSLGTVVACLFQKKYRKVRCLVLAAPALNQEKLFKRWYKKDEIKKWKEQGFLDTPKFRIGLGYLREAKNYTKILRQIKIPILFLHGEKDEDIPSESVKKAFKEIKVKEKKMMIIPETDHHLESHFGKQKLIEISVDWFKKYL